MTPPAKSKFLSDKFLSDRNVNGNGSVAFRSADGAVNFLWSAVDGSGSVAEIVELEPGVDYTVAVGCYSDSAAGGSENNADESFGGYADVQLGVTIDGPVVGDPILGHPYLASHMLESQSFVDAGSFLRQEDQFRYFNYNKSVSASAREGLGEKPSEATASASMFSTVHHLDNFDGLIIHFFGHARSSAKTRSGRYTDGGARGGSSYTFRVSSRTTITLLGSVSKSFGGSAQKAPVHPLQGSNYQIGVRTNEWVASPDTSARGFDFQMDGTTLFTRIVDFPTGIDSDNQFEVWTNGVSLGKFQPGQPVDFVTLLGGGVSKFTVTGINFVGTSEDGEWFPLQLAFSTDSANFTITPVLEPRMEGVILTPATGQQPSRLSATLKNGPPDGVARLQAADALDGATTWTVIATSPIDSSGTAHFSDVPDSRPNASNASKAFFRISCTSP